MKFTGELGERVMKLQSAYIGSFYQIPKVLHYGKYRDLSATTRELYAVLADRARYAAMQAVAMPTQAKNVWVDQYGQILVRISRNTAAFILGDISRPTIQKCFEQLEAVDLIRCIRRGKTLVDDIYVFAPDEAEFDAAKLKKEAELLQEELKFIMENPVEVDTDTDV